MKKTFVLISFLLSSVFLFAQIGRRMTAFNPATQGFKYSNTFQVEIVNDVRMSGFCGGMVYTALDYFNYKRPIPSQTFRPANGTPLYDYIWGRQRSSVLDNLDKWTELFVNPFGWRTGEFFNWGLQGAGGGRLQELKTEIDKGKPVPLGLFKPGDGGAGPHHQVLAIGYDGGRYKGDLGANKEDLKIFVYDPNFPNETRTLRPRPADNIYYYEEDPNDSRCHWQTYFVNRKYNQHPPPVVAPGPVVGKDGKISEIIFEIRTGSDDLRGGNDNLNLTFYFNTLPPQTINNINRSARWIGNYTETVPVRLTTPVPPAEFRTVTLTTTFGGGVSGDNWNMDCIKVYTPDYKELLFRAGTPLKRFTGSAKTYSAPLTYNPSGDGKARELIIEIVTGGDDLRGGNDNVNLTVLYKDGSKQVFNNLNRGTGLGGGSYAVYTVFLSKAVPVTEIKEMVMNTTFGGGLSGDNWNLQELRICARGGGFVKEIYKERGTPLKRFTGSDQNLNLTVKTD
jgi:hypothetical protein